ncbi:ATP-binding protein [Clostridium algoriphilum]|uniref:ATP-binding protein n=1 Tax=Clostridium algoriphilum TaxID=198347 RepID=UPI001CF321D8|nr:ATP-binding protein [Clostridium algoriphilum]MCB2292715.1 ATP-binding protein [Clostridium algoriphilum]
MELAILSGKGGTGKTTIATALAELSKDVIRIDCDVDAPNLYMFYKGLDIEKNEFIGGKKAIINESLCIKCGICETICKFNAIKNFTINPFDCEGCGACTLVCSQNAIKLKSEKTADTFITKLDNGIISRAEMKIGSDGSGKLIAYLRKNGKKFNGNEKLTIIDGSPGIGCPVISSITGSDAVLIVTEPTKSGLGDLMRVVTLCECFGVFTMVCINKYDINEEVSREIESFVIEKSLKLVGKIPYDDIVMQSINELKPITYYKDSIAEKAIENMWSNIKNII